MNTRVCTRCEIEKSTSEFCKNKQIKDGLNRRCKTCCNKLGKTWKQNNPEKLRVAGRLYYKKHPEKTRLKNELWRQRNPDKVRQMQINWIGKNCEKIKTYKRIYHLKNADKIRKRALDYYYANVEYVKSNVAKYRAAHPKECLLRTCNWKKKRRLDPTYRFLKNFGHRMWSCLKGQKNNIHCFKYVDYSFEQLKAHIESLWLPGMSWDNYGRGGWHLDHIYPEAKLYITGPEDPTFKYLWSLANLQPLWESDNIVKNDKYPWEWEEFKQKYPEKLHI